MAWREADCSREPPHAGGRFFVVPGQKGAAFPDFFAFGIASRFVVYQGPSSELLAILAGCMLPPPAPEVNRRRATLLARGFRCVDSLLSAAWRSARAHNLPTR